MNFFSKAVALLSLSVIAGCVTMDSAIPEMQALKGRPVQEAFAKLGYPDAEQRIAGKKLYVWSNSSSGTYSVPTYNSATSYVNGTAVYTTVQGTRTESYSYECKLRIIASDKDIIENWQWEGDVGGCERYATRLKARG